MGIITKFNKLQNSEKLARTNSQDLQYGMKKKKALPVNMKIMVVVTESMRHTRVIHSWIRRKRRRKQISKKSMKTKIPITKMQKKMSAPLKLIQVIMKKGAHLVKKLKVGHQSPVQVRPLQLNRRKKNMQREDFVKFLPGTRMKMRIHYLRVTYWTPS